MPRWKEYSKFISVIPQEIKLKRDWKEEWDLYRRWDLPTTTYDLEKMWSLGTNARRNKDGGEIVVDGVPEPDDVDTGLEPLQSDPQLYNPNDTGAREIARLVEYAHGPMVYIYGLGENRDYSIAYYGGNLPSHIRANYFCTRYRYGAAGNHRVSMGFSLALRRDPTLCASIVDEFIRENGW
jgi:hypothetical protein